MFTPRSRKPVAIPSFEPLAVEPIVKAHGRTSLATPAARMLARAGELLRPRGDRRTVHRRLVDRRDAELSTAAPRAGDVGEGAVSAFRGATARFVAFG